MSPAATNCHTRNYIEGELEMHWTSYNAMAELLNKIHTLKNVQSNTTGRKLNVLDVGSRIAETNQTTYKTIVKDIGWDYLGLDIEQGINVDIVCESPYKFPLEDNSVDIVISGQVFEHVEFPWETIKEIHRVLRADGIAVIIAPSSGKEHRYPFDCFRYYPDGMIALGKWAKFSSTIARTNWDETQIFGWGDTIGIFFKQRDANFEAAVWQGISERKLYGTWERYATVKLSRFAVYFAKKMARLIFKPLRLWNKWHENKT
jgi:SAM-dependent methyltransferase